MYNRVTTLTEYILQEEQHFKKATGSFTLLMTTIADATKHIASHVRQSGLIDILGQAGSTNTSGDNQKKLDVISNDILVDALKGCRQVSVIASEEMEGVITVGGNDAEYVVFMDPLDGSSNIDVNINIGTIFSIYRKEGDDFLLPGSKIIAAGYVNYGPSVSLVYSCGNGVQGFTLDPSIGSYMLSHQNMKIPSQKALYSINESYEPHFNKQEIEYLKDVKEKGYTSRYVGSMIADVHRTMLKGGLFAYPSTKKKPDGHLRLMYEVNPMSYLVKQAGGLAFSNGVDPLTIDPSDIHQKVPIVLGGEEDVKHYMSFSS